MLHAAHKELQRLVTTKDLSRFCQSVSRQYADIIGNGLWFSPMRGALDAFVEEVQEAVTGVIRLKSVTGIRAHALKMFAGACDAGDRFDHSAATGS